MSSTFEDLLNSDPDLRRHYDLISKVGSESERGMAVLVVAELDRVLEVVLKSYLAPGKARDDLFSGGTPPLGTFSAKINAARALHLIREAEHELLHLIRRIRNEFAHNPDAAFTDGRISSWLNAIPKRETEPPEAKSKFTQCSVELITALKSDAVHQANGRVYEESFNTFYRRGCDPDAPPFSSAEEAAATYKVGKS
jgi:hypothetical protein